jgi:8-oxo-dGTP pyrophosphatase MutT (NUDIX family)
VSAPTVMRSVVVRAAGGLVCSSGARSRRLLVVIHRIEQDDWTFPKGKVEPGEDEETAALREVFEETGFRCRAGHYLGRRYVRDRRGRLKTVSYWVMKRLSGSFMANEEVDNLLWLTPDAALGRLSYEHDRRLLTNVVRSGHRAAQL